MEERKDWRDMFKETYRLGRQGGIAVFLLLLRVPSALMQSKKCMKRGGTTIFFRYSSRKTLARRVALAKKDHV
jgi:hypothetical protein